MRYLFFILCLSLFLNAIEYEKSDNIVIDKQNKLMWQDNDEVTQYLETTVTAEVYCENIILNGYIDWRVPTVNELINIIDLKNKNAIYSEFKFVNPNIYISSTSFIEKDSLFWGINFQTGSIIRENKSNENYIRCIRDIK